MKVTRLSLLGILGISMLLTGCGGSSTKSSLSQVGVMEKDFYDQWVVPGKLDEQLVKKGSANALKDVGIWKMYGQFNDAFVLSFHGVIDQQAAQVILESYLNAKNGGSY